MTREEAYADAMFHHKLVCQSNAYTNSSACLLSRARSPASSLPRCALTLSSFSLLALAAFLITSARCGVDDGEHPLISGSMIVDPEGHIVAENQTEGDELVVADIDLDACQQGKTKTFAFAKHRRTEMYGRICEQTGVVEPEEPAP